MINPLTPMIVRYRKHYYTTIFERSFRQISESLGDDLLFREISMYDICKEHEQAYMLILLTHKHEPYTIYYSIGSVYKDNQLNLMAAVNITNGKEIAFTVHQPKNYNKQQQIDLVTEELKHAIELIRRQ